MNGIYCFFCFYVYIYLKNFMKDWEKDLIEVMSKSNVDNLQNDVINYFNQVLIKLTKEVTERDPMMGENFKKRFVK
jgi:hypothetical protein